jgi:hypothetical protein
MVKQIRWTEGAQFDRKEIFQYWNARNKTNNYSKKLNQLFKERDCKVDCVNTFRVGIWFRR